MLCALFLLLHGLCRCLVQKLQLLARKACTSGCILTFCCSVDVYNAQFFWEKANKQLSARKDDNGPQPQAEILAVMLHWARSCCAQENYMTLCDNSPSLLTRCSWTTVHNFAVPVPMKIEKFCGTLLMIMIHYSRDYPEKFGPLLHANYFSWPSRNLAESSHHHDLLAG